MARGDPSGPTVPADTYYTLLQASIEQIVSLKYAQLLYNVQSMKLHRSTKPNASPIAYKSNGDLPITEGQLFNNFSFKIRWNA